MRSSFLDACRAREWTRSTQGPLTMHLARASSLENAGICLHPIYGFPFLPGTGLKGMARAFAEAVWKRGKGEGEGDAADKLIAGVFGRSADKQGVGAASGAVVFHDAWPTSWPTLTADIVNNHHKEYYENGAAPIDWDDPNPVYLFALQPGQEFSFAVSPRREGCPDVYLELARAWLDGALSYLGAGAKTASGYGYFVRGDEEAPDVRLSTARVEAYATVELVTPAFLAGANQAKDDCDLRAATLKGLLRWWWRTLYSGLLASKHMVALEGALWGDTSAGGAVQVIVSPQRVTEPRLFDFKDGFRPKADFAREHCLESPPKTASPGIFYLSYGMDEGRGASGRVQRYFVDAGSSWMVRLTARDTWFHKDRSEVKDPKGGRISISRGDVLEQARAALWLLCTFGGVGAKSRNGFGCLQITGPVGWKDMSKRKAADQSASLCRKLGLPHAFREEMAESSALTNMMSTEEHLSVWTDPFHALDQVGLAYQGFTKKYKHDKMKLALGLPRKIHGPGPNPMRHQNAAAHKPPLHLNLRGKQKSRFASPIHIHLAKDERGCILVRVVAFPSPHLPDLTTSRSVLKEFLLSMDQDLKERCQRKGTPPARHGPPTDRPPSRPTEKRREDPGRQTRQMSSVPASGSTVEAVLLEKKTKKGGWRARHEPTGFEGAIVNTGEVPAERTVGETVSLVVNSVTEKRKVMDFRWPKE